MRKDAEKTDKLRYEAPELTELGSVEQLTQGPAAGTIDSIFGGDGGFQEPPAS